MKSHFQSPMHTQFLNTSSSTLLSTKTTKLNASSVGVLTMPQQPIIAPTKSPPKPLTKLKKTTTKAVSVALLKQDWLNSISSNLDSQPDPDSKWVLGVDPDSNGALALIRPDCSVEVFDSPHVKVPVGKTLRRRLDANSIIKLLQSFDAPVGTTVYLEQSSPFGGDGKQGWWSMGFGYGMWIGILVASGFSVVPVSSMSWKSEFQLSGSCSGKDASRELASALFPSMSSLLKRKKDHGRAEALLIAAYGKGLKLMSHDSSTVESTLL